MQKCQKKTNFTIRRVDLVKLAPLNRFIQIKECSKRESRFKLGTLVGGGSCGQVYEAMDISTGEVVACKQIGLKFVGKDKIDAELKVLRILDHRNVIKYVFHELKKDSLLIYQEYMPMGSLQSILKEFGPLNEANIKFYCKQLLDGLCYLHQQRIMHLDLKSSNILLDGEGNLKISDFGCSKQLDTSIFNQSTLMGSVPWMAPEVIKQESLTSAADIWSFGCIVIEMITATLPWSQQINFDNPATAMLQISLSEECPNIPTSLSFQLQDFVHQCVQLNPINRASIQQLKQHTFLQ